MTFKVQTAGLEKVSAYLRALPQRTSRALAPAINSTTRFAYAESSREIRAQVAFTRPYLGSATAGNRLNVTRWATPNNPEAVITGRKRATSLARFARPGSFTTNAKKRGVVVTVQPGKPQEMPKAFFIKLRAGSKAVTEDSFNVGIAVRLKPGTTLRNKRAIPFSKKNPDLYILYGPSVDQVFRQVAQTVEPRVTDKLKGEFLRQLARSDNG
jgi:hypothetical protein